MKTRILVTQVSHDGVLQSTIYEPQYQHKFSLFARWKTMQRWNIDYFEDFQTDIVCASWDEAAKVIDKFWQKENHVEIDVVKKVFAAEYQPAK